jgi:hypothetical protein
VPGLFLSGASARKNANLNCAEGGDQKYSHIPR